MKKAACLLFCCLSFFIRLSGQQGISFVESKTWEEILTMAKKEAKYVFVDAYATWCKPCLIMQQNVFTDKSVARSYNTSFINVKIDMEKGEGPELGDKYGVRAYPTFLFFSPNGEVVHKAVGSMDPTEFISLGKNALEPDQQFYTIAKKAKEGKLTPSEFDRWIHAAEKIEEDGLQEIITTYLSKTTYPFLSKELLDIIFDHAELLTEDHLKLLMENRDKLSTITGRSEDKITELFFEKVTDFAMEKCFKKEDFDYDVYKKTIAIYFPERADRQANLIKTTYQLFKKETSFEVVIASDDPGVLEGGARYFFNQEEPDKTFLTRAKQLYTKLMRVDQQNTKSDYAKFIIVINEALNDLEPSNYFGRVERLKQNVSFKEKELEKKPSDTALMKKLSDDYGSLSWNQLYIKNYQECIQSAQKGLKLRSDNEWIYTNLALGHLFLSQFDKAIEIYTRFKNKIYPDGKRIFKEVFLKDLDDLERDGILSAEDPVVFKKAGEIRVLLKK